MKRYPFRKPLLSVALVAGLATSTFGIPSSSFAASQVETSALTKEDQKIVQSVNVNNIYSHISRLSSQPRVAGTPAEYNAVQYIQQKFSSYGYNVQIQPFTFEAYVPPTTLSLDVKDDNTEYTPQYLTYTGNGQAAGELQYVGLGTEDDVKDLDLTGKIALIERGNISFAEKVLNAAKKGAEAVIIYNNEDGELNGTLGGANDAYVPALSLPKDVGEKLAKKLQDGETVNAEVTVEGSKLETRTSHNVIATKKASNQKKDTGEIVVVGAHHDSVEGAPGANDDASGVAVTLELARVMAKAKTDTELRFVTFGAEENGLIGSTKYVDSLGQNDIFRTRAMFQLDMVGSKDAGDLVMNTVSGQPNTVTDVAGDASERLNGEQTPYGQGDRSDHVPFAEVGIPSALFIHEPTEPWYHTPDDTIDKISKEKLQDVAEIVGAGVYDIAKIDRLTQNVKKPKPMKNVSKEVQDVK